MTNQQIKKILNNTPELLFAIEKLLTLEIDLNFIQDSSFSKALKKITKLTKIPNLFETLLTKNFYPKIELEMSYLFQEISNLMDEVNSKIDQYCQKLGLNVFQKEEIIQTVKSENKEYELFSDIDSSQIVDEEFLDRLKNID